MKMWGGTFSEPPDALAYRFNSSLPFDQRLWEVDIQGSVAWAGALARAGVVAAAEAEQIQAGLRLVQAEFAGGKFAFVSLDEDIHTAVERRLGELIGPVAGKLHTGRSRNDQVATDFRLWVMAAEERVAVHLRGLQSGVGRASRAAHRDTAAWLHALSARTANQLWPLATEPLLGARARRRSLARIAGRGLGVSAGQRGAGGHRLPH